MDLDCRFCEIANGVPDEHVFHADNRTLAFLDAEPVNPGHSLVIPREHRTGLTEMEASAVQALYRSVREVAIALEHEVDPDGINAIHSTGGAAGQDVHHAHVHVIPRYEEDRFGFNPPRQTYAQGEAEQIASRLEPYFDD